MFEPHLWGLRNRDLKVSESQYLPDAVARLMTSNNIGNWQNLAVSHINGN